MKADDNSAEISPAELPLSMIEINAIMFQATFFHMVRLSTSIPHVGLLRALDPVW